MTGTPMTLEQAHTTGLALVERHTHRFLDYVSGLTPEQLSRAVPRGQWTAGQTVTHVHSVFERYTTDLRRAPSPAGVADQNGEDIARLGVDVAASVAAIRDHLSLLAMVVGGIEPDREFPFHAGQRTTLAGGWGNLIGELLAHGDDIGRATATSFTIPSDDTEILWRFAAPLLQGWLRDTTVHDRWLLRFPFGQVGVAFEGARLHWGCELDSAVDRDLVISDAAEFALTFPYRRRRPADAAVAELVDRFHPL